MERTSQISKSNIGSWLEGINQFNSTPGPGEGTTRLVFTKEELAAREYVKGVMREIGLSIEEDAIGNIFGTLLGSDPSLPPVWSGSHIDTVLHAGMFDGMTGVVSAMEAVRAIKDSGAGTKRSIQAIVFTSEEPTRFKNGCLGSRAMAGGLSLEDTKKLIDNDGITFYDELKALGFPLHEYDQVKKKKGDVYAMAELHIEQAEKLEEKNIPVGLVQCVTALMTILVNIKGQQEHAGGTAMRLRRDSVAALGEIISELERLAKDTGRTETVATVAKILVYPNATNVISGDVTFSIDLREDDREIQLKILDKIMSYMKYIEKKRGVAITHHTTYDDLAAVSSPHILGLMEKSCEERDIPYLMMRSGAGHDSQLVSAFAPVAMIFVPCRGGVSHTPEEFAKYEDIAVGAEVLKDTLLRLANEEEGLL